jgi:hypothetical protein
VVGALTRTVPVAPPPWLGPSFVGRTRRPCRLLPTPIILSTLITLFKLLEQRWRIRDNITIKVFIHYGGKVKVVEFDSIEKSVEAAIEKYHGRLICSIIVDSPNRQI